MDGKNEPIRNNGDRIEISLQPGNHEVALNWHEPRPQSVFFRTPRIAIGEKAINAKINLSLPADRWLWFTWGPSWGPKVLLWSYLLMLIGAGWILVRIPGNPLRVRQWVLLGIGLTQIPVVVAFLIAAWFFLISWRGSANLRNRALKNLTQVGLAVYSLVFLACLCGAVYDGLVSNPDMLVTGAGSTQNELSWLVDRIEGTLPSAIVISVPVVVFRLLNLLWALWLASSLLGWLRWAWSNYAAGGLWVPKPKAPVFVSESPQTRAGNAQEPTTTAVASSSDGTPPPGA